MIEPLKAHKHLYQRLFGYMRPYLPLIGLAVFLSLLTVVFESVSLWIIATLADTLFNPEQQAASSIPFSLGKLNTYLNALVQQLIQADTPLHTLTRVCVVFIVAFTFKNVFLYTNGLLMSIVNLKIMQDIRDQLFGHSLILPVSYYDRNRSGTILSTILNDVSRLNYAMTHTVKKVLVEPVRLITFIILLFVISTKLTLIVFLIYPILIFVIVRIGKSVRRRSKRTLENMAGVTSVLHETVNCVRAVKMFNMHKDETDKFVKENTSFTRASYRANRIGSLTSPLTELLGAIVVVSLLWVGGAQVLAGKVMTAEDFIRYLTILIFSYQPLKALAGINNSFQHAFAASERVFGLLDSPAEKLSPEESRVVPDFTKEIEFRDVTFTYPGTDEPVLRDVSLTIPKGRIVAFVGSSGAGKTTILDLLPRFYEIDKGNILLDGVDVRDCDLAGLRELFGIVSQETILFNDTVYNNIAYGLKNASREAVQEAAKAASAWEFIQRLPKKLDTLIGERGTMLSGGQCQRLSIARALLRNPPILILDEATSALDTESERLVQHAINNLIENRTALVVAHRLSTIQHADMIVVLDQGRIVETGTHDELLKFESKYKYFYELQFSNASSPGSSSQTGGS